MFARVFDTAKRILSRSPSIPERSSEAPEKAPTSVPDHTAPTMVTTRGGVETPGAATPRSSGKTRVGKRELEGLEAAETPTQAKRQKKAAPAPKKKEVAEVSAEDEVRESSEDTSDTIAVISAPSASKNESPARSAKKGKLAIRRRSSPQVVVEKLSPPASTTAANSFEHAIEDDAASSAQEDVFFTPNVQVSGVAQTTPATTNTGEGSPTPKAKAPIFLTPATSKKQRGRPKKTQNEDDGHSIEVTQTTTKIVEEVPSSSYESDPDPITSPQASQSLTQPKKLHQRFGSEEPDETIVVDTKVHEPIHKIEDDEDDSVSDSDEAPEVVTTAAATSKVQSAQAEASRALVAQQQKEATKRQAREEFIAAQQAAKREREEKKAKKLARKLAKQAAQEDPAEDDEESHNLGIARDGLPALLPDSILSTLPDQRAPTPPPVRGGKSEEELRREKLNHHIKFLERTEKPIKDVKKGKLSVAVLGQHNKVLPPKMSRNTSNVREHWLKGRGLEKRKGAKPKTKSGKMERRKVGGRGISRTEGYRSTLRFEPPALAK